MFGGCAFGLPWPRLAVCPFSVVRGCARQGFKSRGHTRPQQNEGIPRGPSRANKGGKGKIPCRQYFTFALTIAREFLRLIPGPTFYIKVHPGFRRKNAGAHGGGWIFSSHPQANLYKKGSPKGKQKKCCGHPRQSPVPQQQSTGNLFS